MAERFWSWTTPSGARRAGRRSGYFVTVGRLSPGKRALELGCGTGIFLEKVAMSGASLHGIDLSQDLLERAAERVRTLSNVRLHRGNAEQLPFPDETFDVVYGSSILHHLDPEAALREVFRVLRRGGRFVFAEPNILNPQVILMFHVLPRGPQSGVSPDEMAFSRFWAKGTLHRIGFAESSVTPFDFLHPLVPARLIPLVESLGLRLERLPVVREIAGSLLIQGVRP